MARNYRDYLNYGSTYHIYNKVVTGEKLFRDPSDYQDFYQRYSKYLAPYFDTFAYCLIPNHFHFLVRVKDNDLINVQEENTNAARKYQTDNEDINFFLENQLGRMFSGLTIRYNKKNNRVGPLMKAGVKRVLLKTEHRIIYQLLYIHHNPIHHGLVNNYEDWKHSSYASYLNNRSTSPILNKDFIFDLVGKLNNFTRLHYSFKLNKGS